MKEESKLNYLKNTPELLHAYGGHLLITTTKSNGKSNPRLLPLTRTMLQPLSRNRKNTNLLSCKNSNITRITSMRKNMPRKSTIILTSSKNQKLFTLSPKILSVFSNHSSMRTKLIILTSIAMALVVMAFPTNKFQPKTVWEHYCKYTLGIHPSQATEEQYDYFLDCWSGDDEYQYLYDYYEKKYPEYNQELKHYGK